jgi:hypothetical protein
MKKYSLFIFLMLSVGFSQKLFIGLDLSRNIYNNQDFKDLYSQSFYSGYQIGFEQTYKNFHFGISTNLRGNKSKIEDSQSEVINSYEYFSIHSIYNFNVSNKIKPLVGFAFGGNIFDKNKLKVGGIEVSSDVVEMENPYNLILGCDYYITPKLGLRISYNRILNDLIKNVDEDLNWKNHSFSFSFLFDKE